MQKGFVNPTRRNDKRILPLDPQQVPQWATIIKSFALHNFAVTPGSGDGVGEPVPATDRGPFLRLR
jgi:hypothetical protein